MNIENEREAFEAFASSQKWNIFRFPKSQHHDIDGQYVDEFVNGAWTGWIESKKHGAEKLEGCVVVPVESLRVAMKWMHEDINAAYVSNEGFIELFNNKPTLEKILKDAEGQ